MTDINNTADQHPKGQPDQQSLMRELQSKKQKLNEELQQKEEYYNQQKQTIPDAIASLLIQQQDLEKSYPENQKDNDSPTTKLLDQLNDDLARNSQIGQMKEFGKLSDQLESNKKQHNELKQIEAAIQDPSQQQSHIQKAKDMCAYLQSQKYQWLDNQKALNIKLNQMNEKIGSLKEEERALSGEISSGLPPTNQKIEDKENERDLKSQEILDHKREQQAIVNLQTQKILSNINSLREEIIEKISNEKQQKKGEATEEHLTHSLNDQGKDVQQQDIAQEKRENDGNMNLDKALMVPNKEPSIVEAIESLKEQLAIPLIANTIAHYNPANIDKYNYAIELKDNYMKTKKVMSQETQSLQKEIEQYKAKIEANQKASDVLKNILGEQEQIARIIETGARNTIDFKKLDSEYLECERDELRLLQISEQTNNADSNQQEQEQLRTKIISLRKSIGEKETILKKEDVVNISVIGIGLFSFFLLMAFSVIDAKKVRLKL